MDRSRSRDCYSGHPEIKSLALDLSLVSTRGRRRRRAVNRLADIEPSNVGE